LGQDAFDFVESDVQNDLARALTLSVSEPENAVVCIGRALEDHLKLIANARNIQLVDHNGNDITSIGPIISKLRHHRVIAKHQGNILRGLEVFTCTELLRGLNAWRNMPVHGRDSEADMRWSLGTEVALVGTFQLLLSIRSTYHYVVMHRILY
jgi:hypothetical protein